MFGYSTELAEECSIPQYDNFERSDDRVISANKPLSRSHSRYGLLAQFLLAAAFSSFSPRYWAELLQLEQFPQPSRAHLRLTFDLVVEHQSHKACSLRCLLQHN